MRKLYGIIPPITTPFLNGELALGKLAHNFKIWNKTKLSGFVVMGSNGESVFLTRDEKLKLIEAVKNLSADDKLIIAGTGSDSIKETISLSNDAAELGADYALVLTPSFYKSEMKSSAFIKYFHSVADSTKIPVIIYNVPKFTGVDIEIDAVSKLSEHPNIAGIKNSTENIRQIIDFVQNTNNNFKVLVGTASMIYSGYTAGAVGGIAALANIAPNECIEIISLIENKNFEEALILQNNLIPINKAVTSKYGVAGLKTAMDMIGYYGGIPRFPLSPLNENDKNLLKQILINANLIKE